MSNDKGFDAWYRDADMPEQRNGKWFDLETGLSFEDSYFNDVASPSTRTKMSSTAITARAAASKFGGKALTGTKKQKEWGEKIRSELVQKLTPAQAEILVRYYPTAKFWIENRATPNLGAAAEEAHALIMQGHQLLLQADAELVCEGRYIKSFGRYHEIMAERSKVRDRLHQILVLPKH
ncbi:hypothetical protein [Polaromonas naphthalenivorans]|uniref:Uncharacterized protein n=1 Tax=Polaromonas naphthalenivorans (strain CJ2) TaxID=365044 RepID=A1VVQ7_POLNA|nr:hypothetical protein [Polaromonas naphthalenivorans]ABM39735.1 hypothetical protein Pnap_4459 [Polaromonas naphthalenivorans CJ2]